MGRFGGPMLVDRIVANSTTVAVSDSVKTASGFAALTTTGDAVLGHVESVIADDGLNPKDDGSFLANVGSEFTTESDNQTSAKVRVRVDVAQDSLYIAELDDTIGTTTGSDLAGYKMDVADEDTLDESTAATSSAQYYSHGPDRVETDKVVVNIFESEVFTA